MGGGGVEEQDRQTDRNRQAARNWRVPDSGKTYLPLDPSFPSPSLHSPSLPPPDRQPHTLTHIPCLACLAHCTHNTCLPAFACTHTCTHTPQHHTPACLACTHTHTYLYTPCLPCLTCHTHTLPYAHPLLLPPCPYQPCSACQASGSVQGSVVLCCYFVD